MYQRPEGKSGGHGVGWSEIPRYKFKAGPRRTCLHTCAICQHRHTYAHAIADIQGSHLRMLPAAILQMLSKQNARTCGAAFCALVFSTVPGFAGNLHCPPHCCTMPMCRRCRARVA